MMSKTYKEIVKEVSSVLDHAMQKEKARRAVAKIIEERQIDNIINYCLTGE